MHVDNRPQLDSIFSLNMSTGVLTVDAVGTKLVTEGVEGGELTVSIIYCIC